MRRSTRDIIGGITVLICCVLAYAGLRVGLTRLSSGDEVEMSQEERDAVARFEADRLADSARQQAYWDSLHAMWADQKAARQSARIARERAYADSQRVWAARREQWAREKSERQAAAAARQAHYDSLRQTFPKKLPAGSTVDINHADTTLLKQIPGIGSVYARKIVNYRESLGGFVHISQIEEIDGLPHGIAVWFRIASDAEGSVRRINVNRADFKTLVHHPYLSYEQTKAIVNLRQRTSHLRGWSDFKGSTLFTDNDFARLQPYFSF